MKTLAQKRSKHALEKVLALKDDPSIELKDFKNFSAGFPAMIINNGLGHSLAFLLAKGKPKHRKMFEIVKEWVIKQKLVANCRDDADFFKKLQNSSQNKYLQIQAETMKLLEWVKRFSSAFCDA